MAVAPPASMTTSAVSTAAADAVPTSAIRSSSVMTVSPGASGRRQSPVTMHPRLTMATFMRLRRRTILRTLCAPVCG
jgi:hypothetical protein